MFRREGGTEREREREREREGGRERERWGGVGGTRTKIMTKNDIMQDAEGREELANNWILTPSQPRRSYKDKEGRRRTTRKYKRVEETPTIIKRRALSVHKLVS